MSTDEHEQELLRSLALGNSGVIHQIYKESYITIQKMVLKLHGNEDDALDVFQDAITIVYEKAKSNSLVLTCKLNTYITAVAKNLWLSKFNQRIQHKHTSLPKTIEELSEVPKDVEEFLLAELNVEKLKRALQTLGSPCNTLLEAHYFQHKNMQQLTYEFGYTNTDNAKTQKYKCLNRLRKIFFEKK